MDVQRIVPTMSSYYNLLWLIPTALIGRKILRYIKNWRIARSMKLPYIFVPYFEIDLPLAPLARTPLYTLLFDRILPRSVTKALNIDYVRPDWRWATKYEAYDKFGDVFIAVTPTRNIIHVASAEVITDLLSKRLLKYQPVIAPFKSFGDNVLTVDGHDWRRHRRIVTQSFNDTLNALIWEEVVEQGQIMFDSWLVSPEKGVRISEPLRTLGINTISLGVLGVPIPFQFGKEEDDLETEIDVFSPNRIPPGHKMTFQDSITRLTDNPRLVLAIRKLPQWAYSLLPGKIHQTAVACNEFLSYLHHILAQSRQNIQTTNTVTVVSSLTRDEDDLMLSTDEQIGNLLAVVMGGHETTHSAILFAITQLAINQDKQTWFHAQLDENLREFGEPHTWKYADINKLTGPACVVFETLRLFPTVPLIHRWTGDSVETMRYNGQAYIIPPDSIFSINLIGLHYSTLCWGADAADFKPERWSLKETGGTPDDADLRFPGVRRPQRGTYFAWGDGPRTCFGRRVAQVEMIALLCLLFRHHRVLVAPLEGETKAQATKRAVDSLSSATSQGSLGLRQTVDFLWVRR